MCGCVCHDRSMTVDVHPGESCPCVGLGDRPTPDDIRALEQAIRDLDGPPWTPRLKCRDCGAIYKLGLPRCPRKDETTTWDSLVVATHGMFFGELVPVDIQVRDSAVQHISKQAEEA